MNSSTRNRIHRLAATAIALATALQLAACAPGEDRRPPTAAVSSEAVASHEATSVIERAHDKIAFWTTRLQTDPFDDIACGHLADAQIELARATGSEEAWHAAESALERGIELRNGVNVAEFDGRLAVVKMAFHQFTSALEIVEHAIADAPDDDWLGAIRGDALAGLGRLAEARAEYEAFASAHPGFSAFTRMAHITHLMGEPRASLDYWHRARHAALHQDAEPRAWTTLMVGVHWLRRGDMQRARTWFEQSLRQSPDYYLAMEHIAETYEVDGNDELARPMLEAAIAIKRDPGLLTRLADIEQRAGHGEAASELRREARQTLEQSVAAGEVGHLRALAEMLLDSDHVADRARALDLARQDVAIREDLTSLCVLARACRLNGRLEEATAYIQRATRFGTPVVDYYLEAAAIHSAADRPEQAKAMLDRARRINPRAARDAEPIG